MTKILGKIIVFVLVTLVIIGVAFAIDNFLIDKGEDLIIPDVGIKGVVISPTFVTEGAKPMLFVFVKKEASEVKAEVAKRVAPTKGGDVLGSYELKEVGLIAENKVDEESESEEELYIWGAILDVPKEDGQYLVTVEAKDQPGVGTKFKMFNYIMSRQSEAQLEKIPGKTPGQSAFNNFLLLLESDEDGILEEAYDMLAYDTSWDDFVTEFDDVSETEVLEYELLDLSLENQTEKDRIKYRIVQDGEERTVEAELEFELNREDPTDKWKIIEMK